MWLCLCRSQRLEFSIDCAFLCASACSLHLVDLYLFGHCYLNPYLYHLSHKNVFHFHQSFLRENIGKLERELLLLIWAQTSKSLVCMAFEVPPAIWSPRALIIFNQASSISLWVCIWLHFHIVSTRLTLILVSYAHFTPNSSNIVVYLHACVCKSVDIRVFQR